MTALKKPMPAQKKTLPFSFFLNEKEFEMVKAGYFPKSMEDKWEIFVFENELRVFRSWTGVFVYSMPITKSESGYTLSSLTVNRDKSQYNLDDDNYDIKSANYLISALLLKKTVEYPYPKLIKENEKEIFRQANSGDGKTNQTQVGSNQNPPKLKPRKLEWFWRFFAK